MTREEFIKVLEEKDYSYEIEGDRIVVTDKRNVWLNDLTSLPPGVEFRNEGWVYLDSLTSIPPGVAFRNDGDVYLNALTSLPPDVEFKNGGDIDLRDLTSIPPGVEFKNRGNVFLESLTGDWFNKWKGNIEGINNKRLLNMMIYKGLFER